MNGEKSPSKETLTAAVKAADVEGKWAASAWGKKIAKQAARKNLTDFERYKVMVARVKRSALIKKALKKRNPLGRSPERRAGGTRRPVRRRGASLDNRGVSGGTVVVRLGWTNERVVVFVVTRFGLVLSRPAYRAGREVLCASSGLL